MADHAVDDNNDDGDIFIYRGGRAPQHITHARIDESVDEIEDNAFEYCRRLVKVETHDGIRKIGKGTFYYCESLRWMNLKSVVEIGRNAFTRCKNLETVEFGDRLETIGHSAFIGCTSIKHLKLPSIITMRGFAFSECTGITDVEFSERLETIEELCFYCCEHLQRIAIPLKRDLFTVGLLYSPDDDDQRYDEFDGCEQLTAVDLVGGIHKTVASLHMESWRTEMNTKINQINQDLPNTPVSEKTDEIKRWMDSVIDKMDHYKSEHYRYVKEGITLLELALWKFKLGEKEEYAAEGKRKKAKVESARKEGRITCGADIVIKNVLPFLQLE